MQEEFKDKLNAQLKVAIEESFTTETCIEGVSISSVKALEEHFSVRLPQIYVEFLLHCGAKAGKLLDFSVIREYSGLVDLREEVDEMIAEEEISFPESLSIFFFASFQGTVYWYFLCDGTDDPDVYKIEEGIKEPIYSFSKLSSFIIEAFEEDIAELRYFSGKAPGLTGKFFPGK